MDKQEHLDKVKARYVAPISEAELACRILEAMMEKEQGKPVPRPEGLTADQALAIMDPMMREMALAAAHACMTYWAECIAQANSSN